MRGRLPTEKEPEPSEIHRGQNGGLLSGALGLTKLAGRNLEDLGQCTRQTRHDQIRCCTSGTCCRDAQISVKIPRRLQRCQGRVRTVRTGPQRAAIAAAPRRQVRHGLQTEIVHAAKGPLARETLG